jgi:hypothetical protein
VRRRRGSRGQSAVEFALLLPVMLLLFLGTVDLARGYYLSIETSGAARSGARAAVVSDTSDIGDAIRSEPNTAIANTQATWGDTWKDQVNGCTPTTSTKCGDPNGCPPSVFTGTRLACFAVRTCTLSSGGDVGTCSSYSASWATRPASGTGAPHAVQVLVVYKLAPVTPLLGELTQNTGGNLYIKNYALGNELYF